MRDRVLFLVTFGSALGCAWWAASSSRFRPSSCASADGARLWADYVVTWTAWNHVRTIGGLAAAAALIMALLQSARAGAGA